MTAGTDGAGLLPEHAAPICRRNRQILWSCWFV